MITTLFFLLLIAFQLWYITSQKIKFSTTCPFLQKIVQNRKMYRQIGAGIVLIVTAGFIYKLGWMTGIFASLVGLMCVGCLVVLLQPYRYIGVRGVLAFYAVFIILEICI